MSTLIPAVTLSGHGWVLRPPRPVDAAPLLTMMQDPATQYWNPAKVTDLATATAWCVSSADWFDGDHATFSVLRDDEFYGTVAVHAINRDDDVADIGYRTHLARRGQGGASAAVQLAADWALSELGLIRLALQHAIANPASCAVAARAGFELEGVLRSSMRGPDGVRHDEHLHARIDG